MVVECSILQIIVAIKNVNPCQLKGQESLINVTGIGKIDLSRSSIDTCEGQMIHKRLLDFTFIFWREGEGCQ